MGDSAIDKSRTTRWWENPSAVAILVAITALIPPITAGVSGYISSRAELRLQREENLHLIQMSYLDRALDLDKSLEYRAGVLEFLTTAVDEGPLKNWSQKALAKVDLQIRKTSELDRRLEQALELQAQAKNQIGVLLDAQKTQGEAPIVEPIYDMASELGSIREEIDKLKTELKEIGRSPQRENLPVSKVALASKFGIPIRNMHSNSLKLEDRGFNIDLEANSQILAMNNGVVVYQGIGLMGFENFVIIKHDDDFLTSYGFNGQSLVSEKNKVLRGGRIALSKKGDAYFEIRESGKPVTGSALRELISPT